ncbi:MAG: thiamine pyrophosphate-dependent enzyme [bacterium]|jgi:2-oxoglutarate ferredoxin oxidoreductase subunit beta
MEKVYAKPASLLNIPLHYCPGCTHGIAHKLIAECIDEFGIREKTIGVAGIGCSFLNYFDIDVIGAAHGRAPATASGVRRVQPDAFIFTYQGDGDCSTIGAAEALHAAARGERVTTFMINNGVFAMTGGQKSATTLLGQRTTTTQDGREAKRDGIPIKFAEIIAQVPGAAYVARGALNSIPNIAKAKKYIKKAIELQLEGKGYCFVELLSTCPTNWGLHPKEALKWTEEKQIPYFPLGELKTPEEVA